MRDHKMPKSASGIRRQNAPKKVEHTGAKRHRNYNVHVSTSTPVSSSLYDRSKKRRKEIKPQNDKNLLFSILMCGSVWFTAVSSKCTNWVVTQVSLSWKRFFHLHLLSSEGA